MPAAALHLDARAAVAADRHGADRHGEDPRPRVLVTAMVSLTDAPISARARGAGMTEK